MSSGWRGIWTAFLLVLLLAPARADTPEALGQLLETLARSGVLTTEQVASILATARLEQRARPVVEAETKPAPRELVLPRQAAVTRLAVGGKIHAQWDSFSTRAASGAHPAARNSFHVRRMEISLAGDLGAEWSGTLNVDFSSSNPINEAFVTYKGFAGHRLLVGKAKAPFVWEEEISDSVLKGVERSASHRAVVEHPGRAVGSKIMGVHLQGKGRSGLYYAAAVTNAGANNSAGYAGNVSNQLAYWLRLGVAQPLKHGALLDLGVDGTVHPDLLPGGPVLACAAHAHLTDKRFALLAEVVVADYPLPGLGSAQVRGAMFEPAFKLSERWEIVLRASAVESDGIGLQPEALVRGMPSTGQFSRLTTYYLGGNCYVVGQAVKLTFGYEQVRATRRVTGLDTSNRAHGFRCRMQLLF